MSKVKDALATQEGREALSNAIHDVMEIHREPLPPIDPIPRKKPTSEVFTLEGFCETKSRLEAEPCLDLSAEIAANTQRILNSLNIPTEFLMSNDKNTPNEGMEKRAVVSTTKEKKAHAAAAKGAVPPVKDRKPEK